MLWRVIHAVIFDLDGTLVHSLPGIAGSLNRVLEKSGMPTHSEAAVRGFIGNGMRVLLDRAMSTQVTEKELDGMVKQLKDDYARTWLQGTAPYPGVTEVLATLRDQGIGTAVFSNKPHIFCQEITDTLFPDITFSKVLGQRDGIAAKPDPTGAFDIANELKTPPAEIAFLGDSTIDLVTAENAGMIPVAATWGYHDRPRLAAESPAYSIDDISELLSIFTTPS